MTADQTGRRRRLCGTVALGAGITALSVSSGSLATGVLLTVGLLGVTAGVLLGACLLLHLSRAPVEQPTDEDAGWRARAAERIRVTMRVLLSRPWLSGPALLRVVNRELETRNASLVSPRGQRIAAPHLSLRFHPADLRSIGESWPVWVLAAEFAAAYVDASRRAGLRRVADQVWVHITSDGAVPLGRVALTPAFGPPPDRDPETEAWVLNSCPAAAGAQMLVSGPVPRDPEPSTVVHPTVPGPANPTVRLRPPRRVEPDRLPA